jgi:hypothetical protein
VVEWPVRGDRLPDKKKGKSSSLQSSVTTCSSAFKTSMKSLVHRQFLDLAVTHDRKVSLNCSEIFKAQSSIVMDVSLRDRYVTTSDELIGYFA